MTKKLYKFKLLLDENIPPRSRFPRLNSRYDVKHIKLDLKYIGIPDDMVYAIAKKQKRIIVTFNYRDFQENALKSKQCGVIGLSTNLTIDQIDKKLTALLRKTKPINLFGKFTTISS